MFKQVAAFKNARNIFFLLLQEMLSADKLCKQFGPRPGPTECRSCSGSKLFDTLIVFLKEFFEKVNFEKISRQHQKHEKLLSMQRVGEAYLSKYLG